MHKKKNQKHTTNLVAQKQADTSQTNKPKPTLAQPILLKEEDKTMNTLSSYKSVYILVNRRKLYQFN